MKDQIMSQISEVLIGNAIFDVLAYIIRLQYSVLSYREREVGLVKIRYSGSIK